MNMKVIKISKVAFDIMFVIGIIGIVLVSVLTIVSPFIVEALKDTAGVATSGDFFGVPVTVDVASLNEATVTQLAYAAGASIVVAMAFGTYIAHQIRRALRAVLGGSAFRDENYDRLRKVAYAAFGLIPVGWITNSWIATVTEGSWNLKIDLPFMTIAGGLLALAVAEIYKAGITLQDESELTV